MTRPQRPLKWDDTVARHHPDSLPFLQFYVEMQQAAAKRGLAWRARQWLAGRSNLTLG